MPLISLKSVYKCNLLVNLNGCLIVRMNLGVAGAMDQLLDEVDEKESAAKEDFCRRNSTQIVGSTLDTFANLNYNDEQIFLFVTAKR